MKLQILSDLHLEFSGYTPAQTDADVVILAGDIHIKGRAIAWARECFTKPVIYVPGNHEFYGSGIVNLLEKMQQDAAGSNVHVMHDREVIIDGVRFLGGTLWTDYRLLGEGAELFAQFEARTSMRDFQVIRDDKFSRIKPSQLAAMHARTRRFLAEKLAESFAGPTVVVTHHAPSEQSIPAHFRGGVKLINASYASNLEPLMGTPDLWVHGHIHDSLDYEMNGTRIVCNPRGYLPSEPNPDFNDHLIVEV